MEDRIEKAIKVLSGPELKEELSRIHKQYLDSKREAVERIKDQSQARV
jgi:hypothetical protein